MDQKGEEPRSRSTMQRKKSSCAKKAETANSNRSLSFRTESGRWKVQARTTAPLLGSSGTGSTKDLCSRMITVTASFNPTTSEGNLQFPVLYTLTWNMWLVFDQQLFRTCKSIYLFWALSTSITLPLCFPFHYSIWYGSRFTNVLATVKSKDCYLFYAYTFILVKTFQKYCWPVWSSLEASSFL